MDARKTYFDIPHHIDQSLLITTSFSASFINSTGRCLIHLKTNVPNVEMKVEIVLKLA
jgi:hypothetical protein